MVRMFPLMRRPSAGSRCELNGAGDGPSPRPKHTISYIGSPARSDEENVHFRPIADTHSARVSVRKEEEKQVPNGKAGDHPLTDILHYGSSEFGEPVDGLVKEMSQSERFFQVKDEVANVLWDCSPAWRQAEKDALVAKALDQLRGLQKSLTNDR